MCNLPVDFGVFSTLGELQVLVVVCIFVVIKFICRTAIV